MRSSPAKCLLNLIRWLRCFCFKKKGFKLNRASSARKFSMRLINLFFRLSALNPSDRPQDARKFSKELVTVLRQSSILTQPIDIPIKPEKHNMVSVLTSARTMPSPSLLPVTEQLVIADEIPEIVWTDTRTKSKLPVYLGLGILILAAIGSLLAFAIWKSSPIEAAVVPMIVNRNSNIAADAGNRE